MKYDRHNFMDNDQNEYKSTFSLSSDIIINNHLREHTTNVEPIQYVPLDHSCSDLEIDKSSAGWLYDDY